MIYDLFVKSGSNAKKSRNSRPESMGSGRGLRVKAGICVFLAVIVWVVFGQTRNFEFVNYDDAKYVMDNPSARVGITAGGMASAFSTSGVDNWIPLTTISHMVDCQLYGLNAGGHHFD